MRRFRRRFSRFKRRSPYDTQRILQCRTPISFVPPVTCASPFSDVIPLATTTGSGTGVVGAIPFSSKAVQVRGIKFQMEYAINSGVQNNLFAGIADFIELYEAIIVLPFGQGAQVPAYVPLLTTALENQDIGDRILWKRIGHLVLVGTGLTGGSPRMESTSVQTAYGPQVVKSAVRLDERHGLFYVVNIVMGLGSVGEQNLVMARDGWFTLFLKASR